MNLPAVSEANFDLGWMNVDVHTRWIHIHVQSVNGLSSTVQDITVGTFCGVGDDFVPDKATINVGELMVGLGPCSVGHTGSSFNPNGAVPVINHYGFLNELWAQHIA